MRLADKVAVITGAASGFGRASAVIFAKEGAKVVVADINDDGGQETVSMIKEKGGEATFIHTDVSKAAEIQNLIDKAVNTYNKIDILFNNAGIPQKVPVSIYKLEEAEWDKVYDTNVKSIYLSTKYL